VPGLVRRTCGLAKFGRPSASLATTSPSRIDALAGHLAKELCDRGKALGEVAAEQDDARAHLVGLHAVGILAKMQHVGWIGIHGGTYRTNVVADYDRHQGRKS
jgi:hypothetical protein